MGTPGRKVEEKGIIWGKRRIESRLRLDHRRTAERTNYYFFYKKALENLISRLLESSRWGRKLCRMQEGGTSRRYEKYDPEGLRGKKGVGIRSCTKMPNKKEKRAERGKDGGYWGGLLSRRSGVIHPGGKKSTTKRSVYRRVICGTITRPNRGIRGGLKKGGRIRRS